jgi:putative toxin-antitoxin system antitoxin component (TIGR02293 family)
MTATSYEPRAVRIGRLLALDHPEQLSDARLAMQVGDGLSVSSAEYFFGGLGGDLHMSDVISDSTLRRMRGGSRTLSREHSDRIYELSRVLDAALRAYHDDRARAQMFLSRPHPMLDGAVPFELARRSSAGADAVVALIERAMAGVAV